MLPCSDNGILKSVPSEACRSSHCIGAPIGISDRAISFCARGGGEGLHSIGVAFPENGLCIRAYNLSILCLFAWGYNDSIEDGRLLHHPALGIPRSPAIGDRVSIRAAC